MRNVLVLVVLLFSISSLKIAANDRDWDCSLLKDALNSDVVYSCIQDWIRRMEGLQLEPSDFKRASGGPGQYQLVDEYSFDWEIFSFKPFSPEIRILGRDPSNPDGYFIKVHRMYGFAIVLREEGLIWIDRRYVCCNRESIHAFNMPESVMGGPPR